MEVSLQVFVRNNDVDQAMRALKKKLQREGFFRAIKQREFFEKPSEKRVRKQAEARKRARKMMLKRIRFE